MKKFSIIISLFLLSACSPSEDPLKEVPSSDLIRKGRLMYEINSKTPFTGGSVSYYENGQLNTKSNYKDGKRDGLVYRYHENGKLMSKRTFKDGKINAPFEVYYDDGQLMERYNFKNGIQYGLQEKFYENGQIEERRNYKNDKLNGPWEKFSYTGQLNTKSNYKDGKRDGLYELFKDGSFRYKTCYRRGEEIDMSYCERQ